MGKKLKDLKKGDHIWFVKPYYPTWAELSTNAPKIYEGIIDQDSTPQATLPFPKYCLVHYFCPELNSNHLSSSEFGEEEIGTNGHYFFTDYNECIDYVKDLASKQLEIAGRKLENLTKDIEELKDILSK